MQYKRSDRLGLEIQRALADIIETIFTIKG